MAQPEKRQRLPTKVAAMKARKRQKLDGEVPSAVKPKAKPSRGQVVRLDDLAWKEVAMPDKIEDYEGFFGLEEIDDVEVSRSTDTGKVSFKVAGNSEDTSEQGKSAAVADGLAETEENILEDSVESKDDEWAGFSEGERDKELQADDGVAPESDSNISGNRQKEQKANRRQKDVASMESLGIGNIPFESLEDETLEDVQDLSAWDSLELSEETLSSLSRSKFTRPTPIQSAAIPEVLAGHDVIGKASTGSGKTLAFGIPILEHYLELRRQNDRSKKSRGKEHLPLALILSPTRELAHQLSAHLTALCSGGPLDGPAIATLTGGLSLQKQQRLLSTADIVIGTPGRLWEIISEGHGTLERFKSIKFLVVDEADRLLSEGHFKEVEEILNVLDQRNEEEESVPDDAAGEADGMRRQTLVFSATFHKGLQQKLAGKAKHGGDLMDKKESMEYLLRKLNFREEKPRLIDVNPISQMAEGLKEALVECAGMEKDLYLYALLLLHASPSPPRTLIFTNSISAVRRLHPLLTNLGLPALALHSQMPQKARLRSIERFSSQAGSILIATDVAARGLDIPRVQLVIHYHLPRAADMYVHRSGRTARAETSGSSVLICAPEEVAGVRRLVAKVHAKSNGGNAGASRHYIRSLDLDRRVVARLKPRVTLAKKLADTATAKEKVTSSSNSLFRQAAEDLGLEYDSEELEQGAKGRQGRGKGRKRKEREARSLSKAETSTLRAELRALLGQRVNVGVSERYITGGRVDVDALLRGEKGEFLGHVDGLEDL